MELTVHHGVSVSIGPVGVLSYTGWLRADESCCIFPKLMDYDFRSTPGGAFGLSFGFSMPGITHRFDTPCIEWNKHNGIGLFAGGSIGILFEIGYLKIGTPWTNHTVKGLGIGLGAGGFFNSGTWKVKHI